jgi:mannose-6-phosphate isomerase
MEICLRLLARRVEKPWGRDTLPAIFGPADGRRIGEIWFEPPDEADLPLLAKYLFTSDHLSVQVHPRVSDLPTDVGLCVKNECWYVVEAEDGARIGVGLRRPLSAEEARQAALDGTIEHELAWKPVQAGDFIFVPAGTVHSIGAGLTMLEMQQNCDVTYRLFDFGRPRDLQLEEALAVADLGCADPSHFVSADDAPDRVLISAPQFTVARVSTERGARWMADRVRWVLPLSGSVSAGGEPASTGECLLASPGAELKLGPDAVVIVAGDGILETAQRKA